MKRKLILRNFLSPGDLVMLTAAVRDLHRGHPGKFLTDVRSSCPELWAHNPHLTPLREGERGVEEIDCHYPLIDRSNDAPYHCIHGFADFLSERLNVPVRLSVFRGDIHLSREERQWKSSIHELAGMDLPFWIVNAGGKFDYTIKWWDWRRYQQVVDHFRGKILFVQVGEIGHYHPPLRHVVDLRGKTDLRQLVRLTFHAQGVLCGVTALMHLAAAVPVRPDRSPSRAAVIISGGREPTHWEAYSQHQFIHTIGALSCCETGGCWRARTRAIGDGEEGDSPKNLCINLAGELPRCMDMITSEEVIRRIESYFAGGSNRYLTSREQRGAERAIRRSLEGPRFEATIHLGIVRDALARAAREARQARVPPMDGRGVLLLAATREDFGDALACARALRSFGSMVPIECWHLASLPARTASRCRATGVVMRHAAGSLTLAELRARALMKTNFREVLVLSPGAVPTPAPDKFFARRQFQETGALFFSRAPQPFRAGVWKLCALEIPKRTAREACFAIDRSRFWPVLQLWRWITDRAYFFHGYLDGAGGAVQLACAQLGQPLPLVRAARTPKPPRSSPAA